MILIYTTSIIYKLNFSCYDDDVIKRKAERHRFQKGKNMTTMNRWYCLYSESCKSAHLDERELGFAFIHSSIDKHKRGNCVTCTGLQ